MLQRVQALPTIQLSTLKALIRPIINVFTLVCLFLMCIKIKEFINPAFAETYVPKFQEHVFSLLLSLTNGEFKREEKVLFTEIGHLVQVPFPNIFPYRSINRNYWKSFTLNPK